jgi:hypothetical protein
MDEFRTHTKKEEENRRLLGMSNSTAVRKRQERDPSL